MARGGNRPMDFIIASNDGLGIFPCDRGAKFLKVLFNDVKVSVGSSYRSKMPNNRLQYVHRLIVVDDIDELQRRNLCAAVGFQLYETF
jgi:hypothetical protein